HEIDYEMPHLDENCFMYRIVDENKFLIPEKLYYKLMSMNKFHDHQFQVNYCLVISETCIDYAPPILLSFYTDATHHTVSRLRELLMQDDRIVDVNLSSKDGIHFTGFGYIRLKDPQYI